MDIKLGNLVRDRTSGLTGTAVMKCEMLSGTIQIGIQPEGDGKTFPDSMLIDWQLLEVLKSHMADDATPPANSPVKLGQAVEDMVTGYKGIVTQTTTFINGCVCHVVSAKIKKDGQLPEVINFDHKRLKVTGAGVSAASDKPLKPAKTGGPSSRVASMRIG